MLSRVYDLLIGQVIIFNKNTHELIPREGELDIQDVDEYINFVKQNLKPPLKILLQKINSYSYSFKAQQKLTETPNLIFAILNANKAGKLAFESMAIPASWTYAFF